MFPSKQTTQTATTTTTDSMCRGGGVQQQQQQYGTCTTTIASGTSATQPRPSPLPPQSTSPTSSILLQRQLADKISAIVNAKCLAASATTLQTQPTTVSTASISSIENASPASPLQMLSSNAFARGVAAIIPLSQQAQQSQQFQSSNATFMNKTTQGLLSQSFVKSDSNPTAATPSTNQMLLSSLIMQKNYQVKKNLTSKNGSNRLAQSFIGHSSSQKINETSMEILNHHHHHNQQQQNQHHHPNQPSHQSHSELLAKSKSSTSLASFIANNTSTGNVNNHSCSFQQVVAKLSPSTSATSPVGLQSSNQLSTKNAQLKSPQQQQPSQQYAQQQQQQTTAIATQQLQQPQQQQLQQSLIQQTHSQPLIPPSIFEYPFQLQKIQKQTSSKRLNRQKDSMPSLTQMNASVSSGRSGQQQKHFCSQQQQQQQQNQNQPAPPQLKSTLSASRESLSMSQQHLAHILSMKPSGKKTSNRTATTKTPSKTHLNKSVSIKQYNSPTVQNQAGGVVQQQNPSVQWHLQLSNKLQQQQQQQQSAWNRNHRSHLDCSIEDITNCNQGLSTSSIMITNNLSQSQLTFLPSNQSIVSHAINSNNCHQNAFTQKGKTSPTNQLNNFNNQQVLEDYGKNQISGQQSQYKPVIQVSQQQVSQEFQNLIDSLSGLARNTKSIDNNFLDMMQQFHEICLNSQASLCQKQLIQFAENLVLIELVRNQLNPAQNAMMSIVPSPTIPTPNPAEKQIEEQNCRSDSSTLRIPTNTTATNSTNNTSKVRNLVNDGFVTSKFKSIQLPSYFKKSFQSECEGAIVSASVAAANATAATSLPNGLMEDEKQKLAKIIFDQRNTNNETNKLEYFQDTRYHTQFEKGKGSYDNNDGDDMEGDQDSNKSQISSSCLNSSINSSSMYVDANSNPMMMKMKLLMGMNQQSIDGQQNQNVNTGASRQVLKLDLTSLKSNVKKEQSNGHISSGIETNLDFNSKTQALDYHDEFMSKMNEFSLSWRNALSNEALKYQNH